MRKGGGGWLIAGLAIATIGLWPARPARTQGAATGRPLPEISADAWINSPPLGPAQLRGKVVLVEFWTFGCHNCRNVEPHVKAWHARYAPRGLIVVGVHAPEFGFERGAANVRRYVEAQGITWPVAVDDDFETWKRFGNRYWPTLYLADRRGVIRHSRIGEGGYDETEARIRALLEER